MILVIIEAPKAREAPLRRMLTVNVYHYFGPILSIHLELEYHITQAYL